MTKQQAQILRHTLGADTSNPGFRNYFMAGGKDVEDCEALVELGMMARKPKSNIFPDPGYYATDIAKDLLGIKEANK